MKHSISRKDFQRFLALGAVCTPPGRVACAFRDAVTLAEWCEAEAAGLVRLRAEPEVESYFSIYGEPDSPQERAAIEREFDLYGCWYVVAEVNLGDGNRGNDWEPVDSVGMCVYANPLDPFENCNVPQIMRGALRQISHNWKKIVDDAVVAAQKPKTTGETPGQKQGNLFE